MNTLKVIAGALLSGGIAVAGFGLATGTASAFNPQPDPPGRHLPATQHDPTIAVNPHLSINQHR
jgi:hypothetical protein